MLLKDNTLGRLWDSQRCVKKPVAQSTSVILPVKKKVCWCDLCAADWCVADWCVHLIYHMMLGYMRTQMTYSLACLCKCVYSYLFICTFKNILSRTPICKIYPANLSYNHFLTYHNDVFFKLFFFQLFPFFCWFHPDCITSTSLGVFVLNV